jgi:mxaL protein
MAWAADSRIANGLFNTLEMLQNQGSKLVFISDGQEAPPINPRYRPNFSALRGKVQGMIVGAGVKPPAPIPKIGAAGEPQGFYIADEVPHRSSYGESELDPSKIEGYNARNAPFGSAAATGSEHLSALRESYLQQLSAESGLSYHRLESAEAFDRALQIPVLADIQVVALDVRWKAATAALSLLLIAFIGKFSFFFARKRF